jgi:hypothetical protein
VASPRGAYGIGFRGVEEADGLLVAVPAGSPVYAVRCDVDPGAAPVERVTDDAATLRLRAGGAIEISRADPQVRFRMAHVPRPDELVHPYLAPAAAVIARWMGRESVHAGAFAAGGRALGLVGTREAGKSSTLAELARSGAAVLCDDMLVLDAGDVLAGPRAVDLRADAAAALGLGQAIGRTGARERWRMSLGTVEARTPLAGWVFLAWGEDVPPRRLGPAERLARLAPERALRIEPAREDGLLSLVSLPAWEVSRPRGLASLPRTVERLLELATATPTAGA